MGSQAPWPPFSSDAFLGALRDVYWPRAHPAIVGCEGIRVRTLLTGRANALSAFYPFSFYLEPVSGHEETAAVPVRYLADVVTSVRPIGDPRPQGSGISPFTDWTSVGSWDEYLATRVSRPGVDSVKTVQRKAKRLERDFGPIELRLVDDDPDVFEQLIRWKSAQYRRTGGIDRLAVPQNLEFYRVLRDRGLFVATSFRAGGALLGGKIGIRANGRHISRLTVYDPAHADYSPGSVMELETLRASYESGDTEFDFLMGAEAYKFTWATHARWLNSMGAQPRVYRATAQVRGRIGRSLAKRRGYGNYKRAVRKVATLLRRA